MTRNVMDFIMLIVLSALLLTGCAPGTTEDDTMREEGPITKEKSDLSFKSINPGEAPESVQTWIEKNRKEEAKKVSHADSKTYVIIMLGQKSTGGFSVTIDSMQLEKIISPESKADKGTVHVTYHTIEPEEGSINTQALTYPMAIAELEGTRDYDYRFLEKSKENHDGEQSEPIQPEKLMGG
ncbi:PrcB C-terminal [Lentibacillus persicus]|uniref:PrcB C-terminal n=1 Tax=Lentibacillus persicus TaxID=640948 RepID=A0A1I1UD19_9BACI|nr:protease complex subunit PrcB family protein [Lentibacillus persicus]SFD68731.1 PrcB C-terminal [Lentibacillus persicus]